MPTRAAAAATATLAARAKVTRDTCLRFFGGGFKFLDALARVAGRDPWQADFTGDSDVSRPFAKVEARALPLAAVTAVGLSQSGIPRGVRHRQL
jgi:hypothetical protein